ncbi:hypothetical protein EVG20_g8140 [Dentipellis fragilis]|uniref:F-box domain-containing protein n=1 Tax=Dentipellis fragilis TaxID=205917 RepID=A0A4Y9Y7I7_9AGAM|nr:hypothetical protein EVG20_g8140 [Dentipellis fragilis]
MAMCCASKEHACATVTSYRLLPELIMDVIDACSSAYINKYERIDGQAVSRTLRACSLTSHAFLPHSQSHIFRTVELKNQTLLEQFLSCLQSSSERCCDDFGVGKYVQKLVVWDSYISTPLHTTIHQLGPKLPQLSAITLCSGSRLISDEAFLSGFNVISQTVTHPARYLHPLKRLKIEGPPGKMFRHTVDWFAVIFRNGTSLEELSASFHCLECMEEIITFNRLLRQCGSTLRRLSLSMDVLDEVACSLDTSPLKNLERFSLNGCALTQQHLIRRTQDLNAIISNPTCSMMRSITSMEIDCSMVGLAFLPWAEGFKGIPLSPSERHKYTIETVNALSILDMVLDDPAFDKVEDIFILLRPGGACRKPRGLRLHDLFPRMKAKVDARARAGDTRASNGFVVRVWDEGDRAWFILQ